MIKHAIASVMLVSAACLGQGGGVATPTKVIDHVPDAAGSEGYGPGLIHANGVSIDLYRSASERVLAERGNGIIAISAVVDGKSPNETLHFIHQYGELHIAFAYNLSVEPLAGTNKIRCKFDAFTDSTKSVWTRDQEISPAPLPGSLDTVVVESGQVISWKTFPLNDRIVSLTHYIRLTKDNPESSSPEEQPRNQ